MRFVRVFLDATTGEPTKVAESEGLTGVRFQGMEFVDLGLVMDFDPTRLDGTPCSPSAAILERIEKHPLADTHPDAPKVRIKPEHDQFTRHFSPCCAASLEAHVRARGAEGLPSVTRAWLAYICPPDLTAKLGLPTTTPVSIAKALERNRRGQGAASIAPQLEQIAQAQSDARSARTLAVRHAQATAAANAAWAEMVEAIEANEPPSEQPQEP